MKTTTIFITFLILLFCNSSFAIKYESTIESKLHEKQLVLNSTANQYDELVEIEDVSPELDLEGRKPLLLIHGWSFEGQPAPPGGGYWNNFKDYLMNDPELRANFKPYYVKYWSNAVSITEIAAELRNKVEEIGLHEQKIAIIAHSMGGLVSRSYMNEQSFTQGIVKNKKCGELVDQLITLSSPHHGSPMANGPARNAAMSGSAKLLVPFLDAFIFKETTYSEVNRSDLRWDNYDNLMDYDKYSDEANNWLVDLNSDTSFDSKLVCYTSSIVGKSKIPDNNDIREQYEMGAWLQEDGFNFVNDGIVPVQSSGFDGHTVKSKRHFNDYNHADIIRGKEDKTELFIPLSTDLMDIAPLKLTTFSSKNKFFIKHSQNRLIEWQAPSTVNFVNIYFSKDNGQNFQLVASNIDATLGAFTWYIPDINSDQCLIKISNANFETEYATSLSPFTIFHNKITITTPSKYDYIIPSKSNEIVWKQEGLGNKVKIIYSDTKNGIEKIIANEVATITGNNSYIWDTDTTLLPTDEGVIHIQLLELLEDFGDSEIYTFSSSKFQVFGEPKFTLLSPEKNPVDYLGIEGEQLGIASAYSIKWKAEGEIKFIGFYLCDKDKNIIEPIINVSNTPALLVERSTRWRVPEYYGDQFYIYAKAGYSSDSILIETYSEYSFRISIKAEILNPVNTATGVSLQPCFEVGVLENADQYRFILKDTLSQDYWEYESDSNLFCLPASYKNELVPGATYQLTAWALIDTFRTFSDQVLFTAEENAPWDFLIINPVENDSTETEETEISWTRSIGADSYTLQLFQMNELVQTIEIPNNTDTTYNINLAKFDFYEIIEIILTANNAFGTTSVNTSITKKFKTGIDDLSYSKSKFRLKNYPNPFSSETTFEFYLDEKNNKTQIILFDLTGKQIGTIAAGNFDKGINKVPWTRSDLSGKIIEKGIYLYQLRSGNNNETRLLQIR